MKRAAWNKFTAARDHFRYATDELVENLPKLRGIQQKLVNSRVPEKPGNDRGLVYKVETSVVYNHALDDVTAGDDIRLILVADNPGRREQAAENRRYLVGPSGKIAEKFFRENPVLGIDFRKNAIILNKTPVHTPRTNELKELCALGGTRLAHIIAESQRTMARLLLEFHEALFPAAVWIIGYSEMKKGGIFEAYTEALQKRYGGHKLKECLLFFRHFSMNQFTIDLKKQSAPGGNLAQTLTRIGTAYRSRVLGW